MYLKLNNMTPAIFMQLLLASKNDICWVGINDNKYPVIIGQTGIYELDIESSGTIYSMIFDSRSLDLINNSPSAYLIIDYVSEMEV
jgi:hypothetical protein